MNKFLVIFLTVVLCSAMAMAGYRTHYHTGYKTYLGGYGYHHPAKYYAPRITYTKPLVHRAAPIVYAHKSYSKPHVTHYVKPAYHHEVPHVAPVYHSKPVHYLGGHYGHGIAYKPSAYAHGITYGHKGYYHH